MEPAVVRILVGLVLFLSGAGLFGFVLYRALMGIEVPIPFVAPGAIEVMVDKPGRYVVWHDHKTVHDGVPYTYPPELPNDFEIVVIDTDTEIPRTLEPSTDETSTFRGTSRRGIAAVEVARPKSLRVEARASSENRRILSFGRSFLRPLMVGIFGAVGGGMVFAFPGLGLMAWGLFGLWSGW